LGFFPIGQVNVRRHEDEPLGFLVIRFLTRHDPDEEDYQQTNNFVLSGTHCILPSTADLIDDSSAPGRRAAIDSAALGYHKLIRVEMVSLSCHPGGFARPGGRFDSRGSDFI
jgi:hypothetical protein